MSRGLHGAARRKAFRPGYELALVGWLLVVAGCDVVPAANVELLQPGRNQAYSGAPPVVPHEIAELGRGECLGCHLEGDALDTKVTRRRPAQRTPHPELERCTMCHVERVTGDRFVNNHFMAKPVRIGLRSQPSGPWLVPHPLTMRENCLGCHGDPRTPVRLRTTHPERRRCVMCHVPAYEGYPGPRTQLEQPPALGGQLPEWSL